MGAEASLVKTGPQGDTPRQQAEKAQAPGLPDYLESWQHCQGPSGRTGRRLGGSEANAKAAGGPSWPEDERPLSPSLTPPRWMATGTVLQGRSSVLAPEEPPSPGPEL